MTVTQRNNISQFNNPMNFFLFKRKNLNTTKHNRKTQTNKQFQKTGQNDREQSTRSTLRSNLHQTPIDPVSPNTCPADFPFKYKNLPAGESHNNTAQA